MMRLLYILPLLIASCEKDETISGFTNPDTVFSLVEINGAVYEADATISFPEEGSVVGKGPCNSYSASQSAPLPWFSIGPIRATRRACENMSEESEFFSSLTEMTQIEILGDTVILRNDAGAEMVFKAP